MSRWISTIEEARARIYGNGEPFLEGLCAEPVWDSGWPIERQCARPSGHGPDGIYCWQHALFWPHRAAHMEREREKGR